MTSNTDLALEIQQSGRKLQRYIFIYLFINISVIISDWLISDVPSDTNSQVMVKVNKFSPGSVRVKYTVGWLADNDILTASIVRY